MLLNYKVLLTLQHKVTFPLMLWSLVFDTLKDCLKIIFTPMYLWKYMQMYRYLPLTMLQMANMMAICWQKWQKEFSLLLYEPGNFIILYYNILKTYTFHTFSPILSHQAVPLASLYCNPKYHDSLNPTVLHTNSNKALPVIFT